MVKGNEDLAVANDRLEARMLELSEANARLQHMLAEKTHAMGELEGECQRLRSLAEISVDWYWEQDADYRFTVAKAGSEPVRQTKGDLDRAIGKCRWDRPGVVPLSMPWDAHRAVLDAHQAFRNFEYTEHDEQGRPVYFSVSGLPLFDAKGQFQGYRGITRDITSRKLLEGEVREGARFLHNIVESLPIAVHLVSVQDGFRIVKWNRKAELLFGLSQEEAMGRTVDELWPDETAGSLHAASLGLVATGVMQGFPDQPHQTPHQGCIQIHTHHIPLSNAGGVITHILCTTEDITARLAEQARLSHSEARYRAVVSALAEAVVQRDSGGRIVDCNQSAERMLGKTLEEMRGCVFAVPEWQLLREDGSMMPIEEHPDVIARRTGLPQSNGAVCYRKPDGTDLWTLINVQPLFEDGTGTPSGYVTSANDITKSKRAELEIVRLNIDLENRVLRRTAQLETANRELEAFSYSVAHDLRSPLGTIDGFCALLQKSLSADAGGRAEHYMERIRIGVRRMGELTNGLLSLAKLSRTSLNWETVDISAEATRVIRENAERDARRVVHVSIEPALLARGDRALLGQVLENLLANAWKFTSKKPRAEISVGKLVQPDQEAVYFVRDNGAGFDMAYSKKLFGTFQRLHSPEEFGGSGIGLATVYRIVTRHGGRIWAESALGQGSTFFFTLGDEKNEIAQDALHPGEEALGGNHSSARTARKDDLFGKPAGAPPSNDQQFSNAFEHSPIGMALIGLDSQRLRVNGAFCRMLGYSEAEMLARSLQDISHPDDIAWDLLQRKRALAGEIETYQWEKRYIHRSGNILWGYLTCSLVRDADRRPIHFISQILDITDRKRIEQTLRESEERFRALSELSSDWFWELDDDFRFVQVSDNKNGANRLPLEKLAGKRPWELESLRMDPQALAAHQALHEQHKVFRNSEIVRSGPHGTVVYLSISGMPKFDAAGRFIGYRGVARDITEMRRVSEALRASELQLRQITNTVPALIAYVDAGHCFRFHNRAYEEFFGLTPGQIDGKNMREVMGEKFYETVVDKVEEVLSGYPVVYERTQKNARGDPRTYVVNYFPRYGDGADEGKVIGFYSLATDMTEFKRMDRLKSEFISTVSHELRPPLGGILATLGIICDKHNGQLPDTVRSLAEAAKNDCDRLIRLINAMLDIEKTRSSKNVSGFI
jgi:PAS domain S-box-containing protein